MLLSLMPTTLLAHHCEEEQMYKKTIYLFIYLLSIFTVVGLGSTGAT